MPGDAIAPVREKGAKTPDAIPMRTDKRDFMNQPTEWLCSKCGRWDEQVDLVVVNCETGAPVCVQVCGDCTS